MIKLGIQLKVLIKRTRIPENRKDTIKNNNEVENKLQHKQSYSL
jgi:hypothetical protein